jgi:membrane protein YqaA with SNARE-associated domain
MTKAVGEPPAGASQSRAAGARLTAIRVIVFLLVVALSGSIFVLRPDARRLAVYGYPGVFLVSFLTSATILLPAPGIAVVFALGSVLSPFLVSLAAGAGAALGEVSGYAAGFSGRGVAEKMEVYGRIVRWMHKYGDLTILVLAIVPNPFFDLAGMAAGAMRMPFARFMFWCTLGKIIKMLGIAYTGAYSIGWLSNYLG